MSHVVRSGKLLTRCVSSVKGLSPARASRATFPAWMARAVRLKAALLARVVHSMGNAVDPLDFVDRLMRIARLAGKRHHS